MQHTILYAIIQLAKFIKCCTGNIHVDIFGARMRAWYSVFGVTSNSSGYIAIAIQLSNYLAKLSSIQAYSPIATKCKKTKTI